MITRLCLDDCPPVEVEKFDYPLATGSRAARLLCLLWSDPLWSRGCGLHLVDDVRDAVAHLRSLGWSVTVETDLGSLTDLVERIVAPLPDPVETVWRREIGCLWSSSTGQPGTPGCVSVHVMPDGIEIQVDMLAAVPTAPVHVALAGLTQGKL